MSCWSRDGLVRRRSRRGRRGQRQGDFPLVPVAVGLYSTAFNIFNTAIMFRSSRRSRFLARSATAAPTTRRTTARRDISSLAGARTSRRGSSPCRRKRRFSKASRLPGDRRSAPKTSMRSSPTTSRSTVSAGVPATPRDAAPNCPHQADMLASLVEEETGPQPRRTLFQIAVVPSARSWARPGASQRHPRRGGDGDAGHHAQRCRQGAESLAAAADVCSRYRRCATAASRPTCRGRSAVHPDPAGQCRAGVLSDRAYRCRAPLGVARGSRRRHPPRHRPGWLGLRRSGRIGYEAMALHPTRRSILAGATLAGLLPVAPGRRKRPRAGRRWWAPGRPSPISIVSRWAKGYHRWVAGGGTIPIAGGGLDDPPSGAMLDYEPIGSLGGIMRVRERAVDFGASEMPLKSEELRKLGLVQFPLLIGGIVAVVNIDGIGPGQLQLTGQALADIYLGGSRSGPIRRSRRSIRRSPLPDAKIVVVRRSDGSGTTFNFTDFLSKASPLWKQKVGSDLLVTWPEGTTAPRAMTASRGWCGRPGTRSATSSSRTPSRTGWPLPASAILPATSSPPRRKHSRLPPPAPTGRPRATSSCC